MNCFYHSDISAVGICKTCHKGLCPECAADLGHGIACKNKHESEVNSIDVIISRNAKVMKSAGKSSLIAPALYFFMGSVFVAAGMLRDGSNSWFPLVMGAGFITYAVILFLYSRKVFGKG